MRPCSLKWRSPKYNKHVCSGDKPAKTSALKEARIDCAGLLLLYHRELEHDPQKHVPGKLCEDWFLRVRIALNN